MSGPGQYGDPNQYGQGPDDYAGAGAGAYGGGQFELGPGRGQIQHLASLFHPDAPNDVAPTISRIPITALNSMPGTMTSR